MSIKGKGASAPEAVPPELSASATTPVAGCAKGIDGYADPQMSDGSPTMSLEGDKTLEDEVPIPLHPAPTGPTSKVPDKGGGGQEALTFSWTQPSQWPPQPPQAHVLPALSTPPGVLGGLGNPTKKISAPSPSPVAGNPTVRAEVASPVPTTQMEPGHNARRSDVRDVWYEAGTPMATPVHITPRSGMSVVRLSRGLAAAVLVALTLIVIGTTVGLIAGGHGGKHRRSSVPKALLSPTVRQAEVEPIIPTRESVDEASPSVHANDSALMPTKPTRSVKRAKPLVKLVSPPPASNAAVVLPPPSEEVTPQPKPCWTEAVRLMRAGQEAAAMAEMDAALRRGCNISREWRQAVLDAHANKK